MRSGRVACQGLEVEDGRDFVWNFNVQPGLVRKRAGSRSHPC